MLSKTIPPCNETWRAKACYYRGVCLIVIISLFINGCVNIGVQQARNPSESQRPNPHALVVVSARFEPKSQLDLLLRTKGEAVFQGATGGAMAGVAGTFQAMAGGGPLAILLLPIFVPVGAVIGAVVEPATAVPTETIESGELAINKAIAMLQTQTRLKQLMLDALQEESIQAITSYEVLGPKQQDEARDYRTVDAPMVLELSVLELGIVKDKTKSGNDGYSLILSTRARLIDTASNHLVDILERKYFSDVYTATEWLQDNAKIFVMSIDEVLDSNAKDILLEFFRIYYPPKPKEPTDNYGEVFPYYVLKPISPKAEKSGFDLREVISEKYVKGIAGFEFVLADNMQPTFRWESFLLTLGMLPPQNSNDHISQVSYEFVLYQVEMRYLGLGVRHYSVGDLLYRRKGLLNPWHQLEEPLIPCNRYAWSVRMHFQLNGQPRVSEWTGAYPKYEFSPKPWQIRRSVSPCDSYLCIDFKEYFPMFRAPPAVGHMECID